MIMEKNNSSLRYVAGACFAGEAVIVLIDLVQNGFYFWTLLCLAGYALIAVSMFAALPILTTAGAGVYAITALRLLIIYFGYIKEDGFAWFPKRLLFTAILFLAFWVILIVVGTNKKSAKQLSFVAGGVAILRFAIAMIGDKVAYGSFVLTFRDFLSYVLLIVGAFMIGMAIDCITVKVSTGTNVATSKAVSSTPAESQIDRLTKLKGLLDSGVISQEEFETKKKQILGL